MVWAARGRCEEVAGKVTDRQNLIDSNDAVDGRNSSPPDMYKTL